MATASAVSPARSTVRSYGRAARQALVGGERDRSQRLLIGHLRSLAVLRAASVGLFIAHDGEPDLTPLVQWLWDRGTIVALPVLNDDPSDFSMRFVPWIAGESLGVGRYGIPVPPSRPAIEPATLLVSFAAFDATGGRMGRGGGFFDRYLSSYQGSVTGVGFEAQRVDQVPVEDHDQPLPTIVTDLGVRFPDLA